MKNVILASILLFCSSNLLACQCMESPSAKVEYKQYEVVFTATVLEIMNPNGQNDTVWRNDKMSIIKPVNGYSKKLLLQHTYKGKQMTDTIIVAGEESNCELYLKVGESYLIYGNYRDGQVYTSACTRSGSIENHPDLVYLDRKKKRNR